MCAGGEEGKDFDDADDDRNDNNNVIDDKYNDDNNINDDNTSGFCLRWCRGGER